MKKLLMLTAAALIIQVTPVLADNHEGGHDRKDKKSKMFEKYDTNTDGVISEAEFLAKAKEKFSKMDTDGNGSVTKEEVKDARKAMKSKWKEKRGERKEKREERKEEKAPE